MSVIVSVILKVTLLYKRHAAYVRHYVMTLNMTLLQSFAARLHSDDAYDDAHTISCVAMRESYDITEEPVGIFGQNFTDTVAKWFLNNPENFKIIAQAVLEISLK